MVDASAPTLVGSVDWLARSLVRVRRSGAHGGVQGGGVLVDDRHVITCAHVVTAAVADRTGVEIGPGARVCVDFPPFGPEDAVEAVVLADGWRPIASDGRGDIAVLELSAARSPSTEAEAPPLRRPPDMRGHRFRAFGFPAGRDTGVEAHGEIRGSSGPGWEWLQIEVTNTGGYPVEKGFSGAPVWDEQAQAVVGIVVGQDRRPDVRGAFMIPVAGLVKAWAPLEDVLGWKLRFDRDVDSYWDPRARGVERGSERGRFFTGRTRALRELVEWFERPDRRGRVVTGDPGSGKSALLARLVTLADRELRTQSGVDAAPGTLPPAGVVDLAVAARNQTLGAIVNVIGAWLDVEADGPEALVDALVRRAADDKRGPVIVLDGLDEAREPSRIIRELLRPLARDGARHGLRLLVGTRRGYRDELIDALRSVAAVIDLDDAAYFELADLAEYVRRTLTEGGPPGYEHDAPRTRRVALAVAARAAPSFLIARLVSRTLRDEHDVVEDLPGPFPDSVADAMDLYIGRLAEHNATSERPAEETERRLRDLLGALAYAKGAGLPADGDVWPAMASALGHRTYTARDNGWLLETAASYVVQAAHRDGSGRVRLFHEALTEYFRAREGDREINAAITHALRGLVSTVQSTGDPDWASAPTYTRAHLAAHAAAGGCLDDLLADAGYLIAAEPTELLRALPYASAPASLLTKRVYQQALPGLRRAADDTERAAYLRLSALQANAADHAHAMLDPSRGCGWSARWANWKMPTPHYIVGRHARSVYAVAVGNLHGRPVVVSGSDDNAVRVWDLGGGAAIGEPLRGHREWVRAAAVGELEGRPVIVSGDEGGTVKVWDMGAGAAIGEPWRAHKGALRGLAVGELDGRPVVVSAVVGSADTKGKMQVRDLGTGAPIGERWRAHKGGTYAVAVGQLERRPVIVSGGADGKVRVWDLAGRAAIGKPLRGHAGRIMAVALGELEGRPVVVSGGDDGTVRVWDLAGHAAIGKPLRAHDRGADAVVVGPFDGVYAVVVGELEGRPVVVSGGADGTVRVWDLGTGAAIGEPRRGHDGAVWGVAVGEVDGRPVVVSGGDDGTVRVWDLGAGAALYEPRGGRDFWVNAVAVGEREGRPVVISGGADGARLWDLGTGAAIGEPLRGQQSALSVAVSELDGRPVVVSGGADGTVRMWDLETGAAIGEPLRGHSRWGIQRQALGELDRRPVVAREGDDGIVRVWDLGTGAAIGEPLWGQGYAIDAIAVGEGDRRPVVISGSVSGPIQLWDLGTGAAIGEPLHGHEGWISAITVGEFDGRLVAVSGGEDGTVRVWDLARGAAIGEPWRGHDGSVYAVAVGELYGRTVVVSGGVDGTVRVWDRSTRHGRPVLIGATVSAIAITAHTIVIAAAKGLLVLDWLSSAR